MAHKTLTRSGEMCPHQPFGRLWIPSLNRNDNCLVLLKNRFSTLLNLRFYCRHVESADSKQRMTAHGPHRDQHRGVRSDCQWLPVGSVGYEAEANERGEKLVWLEDAMADRLGAMRRPNESSSR